MPPTTTPHPFLARFGRLLVRRRTPIQSTTDVGAWAIGLFVAMVLRFEFSLNTANWGRLGANSLLLAIAIVAVIQVGIGVATSLYIGKFRYGSFDEVLHLALTVSVSALALAAISEALAPNLVPLSVVIIGALLALLVMASSRYLWRMLLERSARPSADRAQRVLVFGAGEGGVQVLTSMLRNPASPYYPVALIDDDPAKRNLRISGVRVVGTREAIAAEATAHGATALVIAIPSASAELIRELSDLALQAELSVRVLPPLSELFDQAIGIGDIRPITEADLLGRHAIDTDIDAIAGFLAGKRVLITGAGGSIGSELCRQIARFAPAELVMLDRDESALHAVQLSIEGRAMLDSRNLVVCDVRDAARLNEVFGEHRPHVVFHAAALKHLPLLEMHPSEAFKTNVLGTQHVLDAAQSVGVDKFVNISTDKAADPCSVLGYTKRIAEMLTATVAADASGAYLSVRFGNVLGSRGSVLTAFRAQVAAGGPVTVTDPGVTRYFMTVEEAVQLVIQAGAIGRGGEALVLDMGEPVRIDDVARRLAAESDRPVEIVYTGLRPGEKLHEVLLGQTESGERPAHPLIDHVRVPRLDPTAIVELTSTLEDAALVAQLSRLVETGAHAVGRLSSPDGNP